MYKRLDRAHRAMSLVLGVLTLVSLGVIVPATSQAFHRSPFSFFRHEFPNLEHWASVHFVLGHKLNSHTPSCVGSQQLAKKLL
jgi:hypothetical protein